MSTEDSNNCTGISNACANCGKEGSDVNNTCNKCKMVMYCNASCKKKHRHKHKKQCEEHQRLAAVRAAKLHDDALFRKPQLENEDCPICFIRLPVLKSGCRYQACCGKLICNGCFFANAIRDENKHKQLCAFCRTPAPKSDEEKLEKLYKRVEAGDKEAIFNLGSYYFRSGGFAQDYAKALELWHQAGELGHAAAYDNIGYAYNHGEGVDVDKKKAVYYRELAAMMGDEMARFNLGLMEKKAGNMDRAIKHYMIAARSGSNDSLINIRCLFKDGHVTKEDYTSALQAYQEYLGEIKSVQRDEAATYKEDFKYY